MTRMLGTRMLVERTAPDAAALQAELTDLLQLEHDALPAYSVAIMALHDARLREELRAHRADHERHVEDLSALIRARGGIPLRLPHMPTGLFKLAVQAAGAPGGDRAVLLAFVSNEWQSQEKYARHAARPHDPEVAALLRRHADDEARHYAWALDALEAMGCGTGTPVGRMTKAFARFHGSTADAVEAAGRVALETVVRTLRAA
ncbi:DUF2383 domain-containing protein [Azospirillum soli]|uniref:DUF2383 domain-containing protein n=1 Tax=Azospirillum soli TaxID=1304799 RepID=UPI001AEAF264|nr:ferritin-like domain-containing protein [Azospirillum soli]MBP2316428.1 rubrerythrin [Azospirillum soli]